MEWINEGIPLITAVTLVDPTTVVSYAVYWSVIVMLHAMSIIFSGAVLYNFTYF